MDIDRPVDVSDMNNIVELIFNNFRSIYDEEEGDKGDSLSKDGINFKQDYSLIWDTFWAYRGIDLNTVEGFTWIDFLNMLHGILLEGKGSLCKMLEYRSYQQAPKGKNAHKVMERKQHEYSLKMKRRYRIRRTEEEETEMLNMALGRMFDYLVSIAKKGG